MVGQNLEAIIQNINPMHLPPTPPANGSGWGTALKPSFEPLVFAAKPLPDDAEQFIIDRSLLELETKLWLLLLASDAGAFIVKPSRVAVALSIARWDAGNVTSTLADLSA